MMDGLNQVILRHLMRGVSSDEVLAAQLGLPLHSLRDRIGSMERHGVITGYLEVPEGLVEAWVFMDARGGDPSPELFKHEAIQAAYRGPGRFSLVVRARGESMDQINRFIEAHFEPTTFRIHRIRRKAHRDVA